MKGAGWETVSYFIFFFSFQFYNWHIALCKFSKYLSSKYKIKEKEKQIFL